MRIICSRFLQPLFHLLPDLHTSVLDCFLVSIPRRVSPCVVTGSPDEDRWLLRERLEHARNMPSDLTNEQMHTHFLSLYIILSSTRLFSGQCALNLRVDISVWKHDSRASRLTSTIVGVGGIHCVGDGFWCYAKCLVAHRQRVVQRVVALREYARAPDVTRLVKGKLGASLVEPDSAGRPRVLRHQSDSKKQ